MPGLGLQKPASWSLRWPGDQAQLWGWRTDWPMPPTWDWGACECGVWRQDSAKLDFYHGYEGQWLKSGTNKPSMDDVWATS